MTNIQGKDKTRLVGYVKTQWNFEIITTNYTWPVFQ